MNMSRFYYYINKRLHLAILLCVVIASQSLSSQTEESTREYLTGNWGGARQNLAKDGIIFQPRVTSFYQVSDADRWEFATKLDMKAYFNGAKIGLSKFTLATQIEENLGQSLNNKGGIVLPVNTAMAFPGIKGADRFDVSSLYMIYSPSKSLNILLGKINLVELVSTTRFHGGAGIDGFMHIAQLAPPDGLTPPYILGTVISLNTKTLNYTFMVYDPKSAVNKTGLEDPFKDITLSAQAQLPVKIAGKPGSHTLRVAYSTLGGVDLGNLNLPSILDGSIDKKSDRYMASYSFDQYLMTYNDKGAGWGIFGQATLTNGNPNPVKTFFLAGLGGNSFIKNRLQDNWGLGYFYTGFDKSRKESGNALITPLRDEQGVELFYNYSITPWLHLSGDIQWVSPGLHKDNSNIFYGGLRLGILL